MNTLYFGDNLEILRDKIPSNSVDLIYLDPPFKSGKSYNIIFQPELKKIKGATAQIRTFEDTWQWGEEAEREYDGLIQGTITKEKPNQKLIDLVKSMRGYLGECSMMAYLCMMAPRLLEMKRVLKETGSIYLHCDPTASHYLKLLMDAVFGVKSFRNEIVWCYRKWSIKARQFVRNHDVIFFYCKTEGKNTFIPIYIDVSPGTLKRWKGQKQQAYFEEGVRKADSIAGEEAKTPCPDWWPISIINPNADERQGYPTQKPEAVLERIIRASSKDGDLVLDPFCGCGTSIAVAERLKRKWIGIDITYLAIDVIKKRLEKNKIKEGVDFEIDGEPKDLYSAEKLASQSPFQFQIWCISKLENATPSQTKTGDQGMDGIINFVDYSKKTKAGFGIIQVKGTQNVNPGMVRDLKGTIKSQNADFGILITLKDPTKGMKSEAVKEGYFDYMNKKIPRIQLLTVEHLFDKPLPLILPSVTLPPYKKPDIKKIEQEEFSFS